MKSIPRKPAIHGNHRQLVMTRGIRARHSRPPDGELAFAVSEVTIASTLQQMLMSIEAADDLEFRGSTASPTVVVAEMTVGGR